MPSSMVVGRFQVMALLQAARAYVLGLPLESAHSWGLNRAIFYAAAKRGFKRGGAGTPAGGPSPGQSAPRQLGEYHLGQEVAYLEKGSSQMAPTFSIGGKSQTEEDFKRQIAARFGESYATAWDDAIDYVQHFDRQTLESQSEFYSEVYRPKRDEFAKKWSEDASSGGEPGPKGGRARSAGPPTKRGRRTDRSANTPMPHRYAE